MKKVDLSYLCTVIGDLCGIPVRIFQNGELVYYHATVELPADPICLYQEEIQRIRESVGYFVTPHFHYYGIVNAGEHQIVIGPARQINGDDQELKELAFRLDVPQEDTADFVQGMKSIVSMPLESVLQIMCTMNYVLNEEKLSLKDITIYDAEQNDLKQQFIVPDFRLLSLEPSGNDIQHNTYEQEQLLMHMIRNGDTAALQKWVDAAPAIRGGVLAKEQLRHVKNTFIVTATLTSRAAIQGGMDVETAYTLSDSYIQKAELLNSPQRVMNLQFHMIFDYTEQVERIRLGRHPSKLAVSVANYVQKHLSESISTQEIADALFISRPHLSKRFKDETGMNLTDYILKEKTEEAKHLLRYTDKSLSAISDYLGFSSPGHFSRVFRKYAALSPSEYRGKYN